MILDRGAIGIFKEFVSVSYGCNWIHMKNEYGRGMIKGTLMLLRELDPIASSCIEVFMPDKDLREQLENDFYSYLKLDEEIK
jgi:hypothetical protein